MMLGVAARSIVSVHDREAEGSEVSEAFLVLMFGLRAVASILDVPLFWLNYRARKTR
jgi:hypothetical protein